MVDKHDYDDLEEEFLDEEEEGSLLGMLSVVIGFLAIVGFITLAWYAYRTGTESLQVEELEVVKAEESPLKETPEDPGGWQFPHQDKTVYETIASRQDGEGGETETLLSAPEEPVDRAAVEGSEKEESGSEIWVNQQYQGKTQAVEGAASGIAEKLGKDNAAVASEKLEAEKAAVEKDVAEKQAATQVREAEEAKKAAEATAKIAAEKAAAEKEKAAQAAKAAATAATAPAPVKSSASSTRLRVQLGAFKSEQEAKASWNKISATHQSLLSAATHHVVRADLGKKGIFYRLQVSAADPGGLCSKLKQRKQDCFVAAP